MEKMAFKIDQIEGIKLSKNGLNKEKGPYKGKDLIIRGL